MAFARTLLVLVVGIGALILAYKTPVPPETITFGNASLTLEYATTPEAREIGLGGRNSIPEGYAMLFVFPRDDYHGIWMKDMQVPIDIFWLDAQGQVVFIASDVSTSTYPNVFYPAQSARYVLETAAGFARANGITIGTSLSLKNIPNVSK